MLRAVEVLKVRQELHRAKTTHHIIFVRGREETSRARESIMAVYHDSNREGEGGHDGSTMAIPPPDVETR